MVARKLNLGCGHSVREGWMNMDILKLPGVNKVWDMNKTPWPFKAGQFDEVFANHVLEHTDDIMTVVKELNRVCKKGAVLKIMVPYFASPHFHSDPTHKQAFTSRTWSYFDNHSYIPEVSFKVEKQKIIFLSNAGFMKSKWFTIPIDFLINLIRPVYERFFCYWFPASEIHYLIRKR